MRAASHHPQGVFGIRRLPADGVTTRALFHVHETNVTISQTLKEENDGVPILCGVRRLQRG